MTSVYEYYAEILGDDLAARPRTPTYIECTDECKQRHAAWKAAYDAYVAKWPNHCRKCDGIGGYWYEYDPSPAGVSLAPGTMTDYDPCPDCIEDGKCPRCGKYAWDEDAWDSGDPIVCPHCGWRETDDRINGAPVQPECWCLEKQLP